MSDVHELMPLVRKKVGSFLYPYGCFPDDAYEQAEGYEVEPQTGAVEDEGAERYRTEILVSAEKLVPLFMDLCRLLPDRVFVSLERASADAYSRWDEFVSQPVPREDFLDTFRAYQFAFAEDGNLGFGAFASDPPLEVFLGSHKEIVVFTPELEPVTAILRRHHVAKRSLELYYQRDHSHVPLTDYRGLRGPQFDFLHVADVVRHALDMSLQMDDDDNVDDEGQPLGLVAWHAVVVASAVRRARAFRRANRLFRQEFGLTAANRREARAMLEKRLQRDGYVMQDLEELFRVDLAVLPAHVQPPPDALERSGIWYTGEKTEGPQRPGPA